MLANRFVIVSTVVLALLSSPALATTPAAPQDDAVDLFAAIEAGDIDAKLIVKDMRNSKLVVRNMTDRPLTIRLPEAVAAVPVLGQAQGGAQPGGFFSVPPEKVVKHKMPFLCLEHGKPDPKSTVQYVIRPIEEVTTNQHVIEVIKGLGKNLYEHDAAQAACWHFQSGMTWEQLASKQRRRLLRPSEPYFSETVMRQAQNIVDQVTKIVEERSDKSKADSLAAE